MLHFYPRSALYSQQLFARVCIFHFSTFFSLPRRQVSQSHKVNTLPIIRHTGGERHSLDTMAGFDRIVAANFYVTMWLMHIANHLN